MNLQNSCYNNSNNYNLDLGFRSNIIYDKGMRLRPNGYDCQDTDECESRNGGCSMFCINTIGTARHLFKKYLQISS